MINTKEAYALENEEMTSQTMSILKPVVISNSTNIDEEFNFDEEVLSATTGSLRMSNEELDFPMDDTISVYEVKKGDTIGGIARLYGVSKNTIVWANDLKSETVRLGDTLVILPMTGIRHTIQKGETVSSIAKKYNADAEDIYKFNGIGSGQKLTVGEVVLVPDGESTAVPAKQKISNLITTKIGWLVRPISGGRRSQGIHGHNGVDLANKIGTSVVAAADGRVILAKAGGWNGGYGSMIIVLHSNGVQTLYSHLSAVYVNTGQTVSQGTVIGALGNTGKSTGPHLHFEVRGASNPF